MIKISHYDKDIDSLIISSIEDNEKVKKNFMFDDFVISTTNKGKIVSLEIREFSNFLEEMGIKFEQIKDNLDSISLIIRPKRELLFIGMKLDNNSVIKQIPIANIPVQSLH
jgi:hypothetical protein